MNFKIVTGLATAAAMATSPLVMASSAVASVPVPSAVTVSTVQPKATITKLKLDKKGRPGVKIKANVPVEVLIAPPRSDGQKLKKQPKGAKTYRLPKVPKGNSVTRAVIVYHNGEILAEASNKPFTWARWIKMSKKCELRAPIVVVESIWAKTAHVRVKGRSKPVKLTDFAREDGETAFGGVTLPKNATHMVTKSPGKPKVWCVKK